MSDVPDDLAVALRGQAESDNPYLDERHAEVCLAAADVIEALTLRAEQAERERDLHVECMCGHLVDDHDGACQQFTTGGGGQEVECGCGNFRPAWAEWARRADFAEARVRELTERAERAEKRVAELEAELRREWWMNHGCNDFHALYGDDGEMQCSKCLTDFRRLGFALLQSHVTTSRAKAGADAFKDADRGQA